MKTPKNSASANQHPSNHSENGAENRITQPCNEMIDDDSFGDSSDMRLEDDDIGFIFESTDSDSNDYEFDSSYISEDQRNEEIILEEQLVWTSEWVWNQSSSTESRHLADKDETYDRSKIVRFSKTLVTEVHTRPKTTDLESNLLFYSMHELQRNIDENSNGNEDTLSQGEDEGQMIEMEARG